jgi:hypothetical protein
VFVVDDGETLAEHITEPIVVSAAEWPSFAAGRFAQGVEELRETIEGQGDAGSSALSPLRPPTST